MLLFIVFVSGGLGILYETIWFRDLSLVVGSASLSLTIILSSFMLGLGLGSLILGRWADRVRPLRLYQLLEMGIGLFALASMFMTVFLPGITGWMTRDLEPSDSDTVLRFILPFLFVLIPAGFMGGTLPVAARYLINQGFSKTRGVAAFYWINTCGAAGMALALPLWILPHVSTPRLLFLGGITNLLLAAFAFLLPADLPGSEKEVSTQKGDVMPFSAMAAFFLSGLTVLALETLWNRHFVLIFGGSTYTFSFILFVFLLGTLGGAWSYPRLLKKRNPLSLYTAGIFAGGIFLAMALFAMSRMGEIQLLVLSGLGISFVGYNLTTLLVMILFVFPPACCFGIAFPAALDGLSQIRQDLAGQLGKIYAANAIGTALGPVILTFFILPHVGFQRSYLAIIILLFVSAGLVAFTVGSLRWLLAAAGSIPVIILLAVLLPRWDARSFLLETFRHPEDRIQAFQGSHWDSFVHRMGILEERTDTEAHVAVTSQPDGTHALFINGKVDASDHMDSLTQGLLGHLPFFTARDVPENVFIIGLGSGMTTHAVLTHPVLRVETAEISPAVIELAEKHFIHINRNCFRDSRSIILQDDGRHALTRHPSDLDLIISEPSNPWLAGIANLYTEEFFTLARSRMRPGGIFCQWLQYYDLSADHVLGILSTMQKVFPELAVFFLPEVGDFIILASADPFQMDVDAMDSFPVSAVFDLERMKILTESSILGRFFYSQDIFRDYQSPLPIHSDLNPWLEWQAPAAMYSRNKNKSLERLLTLGPESAIEVAMNFDDSGTEWALPDLGLTFTSDRVNVSPKVSLVSMTVSTEVAAQNLKRLVLFKVSLENLSVWSEVESRVPGPSAYPWLASQILPGHQTIEKIKEYGDQAVYIGYRPGDQTAIVVWSCRKTRLTCAAVETGMPDEVDWIKWIDHLGVSCE